MWVAGYSLDNLSPMAFTPVGFIVDDAIVMLENIGTPKRAKSRFRRRSKAPPRSVSPSYRSPCRWLAVLIPLLMMSGIIGRLFREFLGHHRDDDLRLGLCLAHPDSDDGVALPQEFAVTEERHGRLYKLSEKGFIALASGHERGVDFVLRHRFPTLLVFIGTVIATGVSFSSSSRKAFFPQQQDTGILFGTTEAGQDVPAFHDMSSLAAGGRLGRVG